MDKQQGEHSTRQSATIIVKKTNVNKTLHEKLRFRKKHTQQNSRLNSGRVSTICFTSTNCRVASNSKIKYRT